MSGKILIIDSDQELIHILSHYLKAEGYRVSSIQDGIGGVKKALNQTFDAIILEVNLPKLNGFGVLKAIREHSAVPALMLTACKDDIDRMVGFEVGADDYLSKPCDPLDLIARLRAILRRTQKTPPPRSVLQYKHITVDCSKRSAFVNNEVLELTNAEFKILEILIKSPGQAFSKEELTEYALGRKYTAYDRSIDVHISNLRNKLENNSTSEVLIKTVRGFGYLFNTLE
jgi:two-component system response regulator CpxR